MTGMTFLCVFRVFVLQFHRSMDDALAAVGESRFIYKQSTDNE